MKRINIDSKQTHFIGCWNLENNKLCNEIISFFETISEFFDSLEAGRWALSPIDAVDINP